LALDAVMSIVLSRFTRAEPGPAPTTTDTGRILGAAMATLGGLVAGSVLALAIFVLPNWSEYWFYNVQMSITRKPHYDVRSLVDRLTGLPIYHDIFTHSWFLLVVGTLAALGAVARWTRIAAAERLLVLWIGLGAFELVLHDVGNERCFIFFIPALAALAGL